MQDLNQHMERFMFLMGEINAEYSALSSQLGVSDSVMLIFYTLCFNGGSCPMSLLRHLTGLSKQTVSSALSKLEREGAVVLEKTDGRQKQVSLTALGQQQAETTAGRVIAVENTIFDSWTHEDKERCLALTERYRTDLHRLLAKQEGENR